MSISFGPIIMPHGVYINLVYQLVVLPGVIISIDVSHPASANPVIDQLRQEQPAAWPVDAEARHHHLPMRPRAYKPEFVEN